MGSFWALFKRELLSLWVTPTAWVLWVSFTLLQGAIFFSIVTHFATSTELSFELGPLESYFGQGSIFLIITLLLLCPALTMRLFAEERKSGTIDQLLTAPIRSSAIVLAKYLATVTTYSVIWTPTLLYPAILRGTGVVDGGVLAASYLGITLLGATYLALGTLMSALSKNQLIALTLTVLVQFGVFVLGLGEYIFDPGPLHSLAASVSVTGHMEEFSKGIVDIRRIVFGASVTVTALFMTTQVVDSWRTG